MTKILNSQMKTSDLFKINPRHFETLHCSTKVRKTFCMDASVWADFLMKIGQSILQLRFSFIRDSVKYHSVIILMISTFINTIVSSTERMTIEKSFQKYRKSYFCGLKSLFCKISSSINALEKRR